MLKPALMSLTIIMATIPAMNAYSATSQALFSEPKEVKETKNELRHFTPVQLITSIDDKNIQSKEIKGKLTRTNYELPPSYTPAHLINNYKNQFKTLNASILFECEQTSCGNEDRLHRFLKPLNTTSKKSPALITAYITLPKKQIYVSIYAASWARYTNLEIDIIEVLDEPLDLVTTNQSYLSQEVSEIAVTDNSKKDEKNSADHPMLTRIPGAYIDEYTSHSFGQTVVLIGKNGKKFETKMLDGKITDIGYVLPRTYSEYEINANYQNALTKLGFNEVYACTAERCGRKTEMYDALKLLMSNGMDDSQFYRLYKLDRPEGNVYVMVYVIGYDRRLSAEVRIIEETTLNNNRVGIDLQGLTDEIAKTGHVALDGLLFKYDSDELLPEAYPIVEVVAQYLQTHPKQLFYVVGHSDDQGSQAYNQTLSEKRAAAIKTRLIKQFSIAAQQVEAKGVGEYSPIANNLDEAGQKQNRRVELVIRSDNK
ncbi:OmpA family protein [Shewanella frigidimarina]|uniref:OmpA family protein n=1 Tax=Shewanella frigidimarina TaxID=56812 RepID=UPI003D79E1F8